MDELRGKYEEFAAELGKLVDKKNAAYGSSFDKSGDVLRILYPEGVEADQFEDMLAIARVLDKLFRIATDRDALGESPWKDIAGYGLLMSERCKRTPHIDEAPAAPLVPNPMDPEVLRKIQEEGRENAQALRKQTKQMETMPELGTMARYRALGYDLVPRDLDDRD